MPTVDTQPDEAGSKPIVAEEAPKSHSALSRLQRELTDDELTPPGARKLLLDRLERAEEENAGLRSFRDKYYEADKRNGVLDEKLKTNTAAEIVSLGSLAVGAAAMGYSPAVWNSQPTGLICLLFGALLTAVGIWAKVIRR